MQEEIMNTMALAVCKKMDQEEPQCYEAALEKWVEELLARHTSRKSIAEVSSIVTLPDN